jgi:hypothetical protein
MKTFSKQNKPSPYYDYYPHERTPFYPNDYDGWPTEAKEGSARYKSWSEFQKKYPFNAQLLIHLFGERDAIDCHMSMQVMSEVKAATLCSFFSNTIHSGSRIRSVSDC